MREVSVMKVSVITNDNYLYRFIELKLCKTANTVSSFENDSDLIFYDCDSNSLLPETDAKIIKISKADTTDGAITLPFPEGFFENLFSGDSNKDAIELSSDGKHVFFKGKKIKLTSHEYALLSLLVFEGGNYTTREKISKTVWNKASDGLINIYIHYLREKLESDGEKIIMSSRKFGYRINPAYLKSGDRKNSTFDKGGAEI